MADLRSLVEASGQTGFHVDGTKFGVGGSQELLGLAADQLLEPRDQAVVRPTDPERLLVYEIVSDPDPWGKPKIEQWRKKEAAVAQLPRR